MRNVVISGLPYPLAGRYILRHTGINRRLSPLPFSLSPLSPESRGFLSRPLNFAVHDTREISRVLRLWQFASFSLSLSLEGEGKNHNRTFAMRIAIATSRYFPGEDLLKCVTTPLVLLHIEKYCSIDEESDQIPFTCPLQDSVYLQPRISSRPRM